MKMDSAAVRSVHLFQNSDHPAFHVWQQTAVKNRRSSNQMSSNGNSPTSGNSSLGSGSYFRRASSERGSGRGSMRKILPAVPDMETQMSLSAKMIDRRTCTPRGNHSYGPFFVEYSLLAEYNLLRKQKLPGVYVIPSSQSPLCWYGIIFIRQGVYQEGIFRFKIIVPENYPDGDCPRVFFEHEVFHPLINPEHPHEYDVRRGPLKKWRRNVNHIWQILLYLRRSFYKIDIEEPVNLEAADLYDGKSKGGGKLFKQRVRECVDEWKDRIFSPSSTDDPHYLTFSPYEPKVHEPVMQAMIKDAKKLEQEEEQAKMRNCHSLNVQQQFGSSSYSSKAGHSFLEPGSLEIFSKDSSTSLLHPHSSLS